MLSLRVIQEIRFGIGLFLILMASIMKTSNRKITVGISCFIIYVVFGLKHLMIILTVLFVNLTLLYMNISYFNTYCFIIFDILIIYLYKIFGRYVVPEIQGTYDISGFLMVLTVKMSYLLRDIDISKRKLKDLGNSTKNEDINKSQSETTNKKNIEDEKRGKNISLTEILNYLLFIPGLVSGPTATFNEFITVDKYKKTQFPFKDFAITLLYFILHIFLRNIPFKNILLAKDSSFLMKIIALYLFNLGGRMKFHFIWNFANCAFILHNFNSLLNIDFYKVEFTESVREISKHWNKFISRWVKELFFDRLKDSSMFKAVFFAHLASACLHGINPCYLLFFFSFSQFSKPITLINQKIPYKWLRQIQMIFFVSYFSIPFYLLNLKEVFQVWKQVYFYGHVYCLGLMIYFFVQDKIKKIKTE